MRMVSRQWRRILMAGVLGCCVAVGGAGVSMAATYTYSFAESSGAHVATAVFKFDEGDFSENSPGTLTIELTNNSTAAVRSGTDVLLGLFFNTDVEFLPPGSSGSAVVPMGGTTIPESPLVDPGDGWQVKSGISISKGSKTYNSGIAGAGYGVFGPDGNLGPNPLNLDGSDYGIVGTGPLNGNGSVKFPVFKNQVEFTIPYSGCFKILSDTVLFQYGTDLSEPSFPGTEINSIPEPTSILLVALGAGMLALQRSLRGKGMELHSEAALTAEG